ncbi:MAG: sigma-70 family RNA polymerase sigma factor [Acidobacteriota bacterium]|nr:sigma-70 family RNA polymerase sigma factor [Acidobacteriota bacterium]
MNEIALSSQKLTELLRAWSNGDREAENELFHLVYDELHRQAHRHLRRERANHSLQTSALINEAYLKLVEQHNVNWQNRAHFFGLAGEMMRRILVDYAKTKNRLKRGREAVNVPLEEALLIPLEEQEIDLLALDEALNRLAELDEQQAKIVELRYFSGLNIEETAEALKISPATVKRDWNMAKAWLHRELSRNGS